MRYYCLASLKKEQIKLAEISDLLCSSACSTRGATNTLVMYFRCDLSRIPRTSVKQEFSPVLLVVSDLGILQPLRGCMAERLERATTSSLALR